MPVFTVYWSEKITCFASIEADTPEEAIEKAQAGEYDNPDSEPGNTIANSYRVREGENPFARIKRKRS